MALYIYRVGGFVPQEILLQDLNLRKSLVVLGLCLDRSDRSVSCRAGYSALPVRPLGQTGQTGRCQFWLSTAILSHSRTAKVVY